MNGILLWIWIGLLALGGPPVLAAWQPVRAESTSWAAPAVPALEDRLRPLLGVPYRNDGALDEQNRYTLFADPQRRFTAPGLNCSGFVTAAARILLEKNFPLATVTRDRLNDSGMGAPAGQDWDFGWDLTLNLSEGFERRLLLPSANGGQNAMDPDKAVAGPQECGPPGFGLTDPATWAELEERVRPDCLYLLDFSKTTGKASAPLLHYHVGILLRGQKGELLLCQTTSQSGASSCRNLSDAGEMARFRKAFADRKGSVKRLSVVEVKLPGR